MKKRVIKKNVNRYIKPLLKGIPICDGYVEVQEGDRIRAIRNYFALGNGKRVPEGAIIKFGDPMTNIKKTAESISTVLRDFKHVHLLSVGSLPSIDHRCKCSIIIVRLLTA
jgi:hypothetical protein